jgi:hypothetical protein
MLIASWSFLNFIACARESPTGVNSLRTKWTNPSTRFSNTTEHAARDCDARLDHVWLFHQGRDGLIFGEKRDAQADCKALGRNGMARRPVAGISTLFFTRSRANLGVVARPIKPNPKRVEGDKGTITCIELFPSSCALPNEMSEHKPCEARDRESDRLRHAAAGCVGLCTPESPSAGVGTRSAGGLRFYAKRKALKRVSSSCVPCTSVTEVPLRFLQVIPVSEGDPVQSLRRT